MTIEKLIKLPTEDIEKMSDDELTRHLAQYFPVTWTAKKLTAEDVLPPEVAAMVRQATANRRPGMKLRSQT